MPQAVAPGAAGERAASTDRCPRWGHAGRRKASSARGRRGGPRSRTTSDIHEPPLGVGNRCGSAAGARRGAIRSRARRGPGGARVSRVVRHDGKPTPVGVLRRLRSTSPRGPAAASERSRVARSARRPFSPPWATLRARRRNPRAPVLSVRRAGLRPRPRTVKPRHRELGELRRVAREARRHVDDGAIVVVPSGTRRGAAAIDAAVESRRSQAAVRPVSRLSQKLPEWPHEVLLEGDVGRRVGLRASSAYKSSTTRRTSGNERSISFANSVRSGGTSNRTLGARTWNMGSSGDTRRWNICDCASSTTIRVHAGDDPERNVNGRLASITPSYW